MRQLRSPVKHCTLTEVPILPNDSSSRLLEDKVAVITGACGALGMAMAERFLAEGASLVITDLSAERLDASVEQLGAGDRVLGCVANATSEDDTNRIVQAAKEAFGAFMDKRKPDFSTL